MALHRSYSGAIDENVFVDDRCPTIWQDPRFTPSPRGVTAPSAELRDDDKPAQTAHNERDAVLFIAKPKPIDGSLLRKLFKATVEEKKRVSGVALVKSKLSEELLWEGKVKYSSPPGFHIPPGVGTPRARAPDISHEKSRETPQLPSKATKPTMKPEKTVHATPTRSPMPGSGKMNLIRISGKGGQEAFVELPSPPPSAFAVENIPDSFPLELVESIGPNNAEPPVLPGGADEPLVKANKKKTKKTNKKANKKQEKDQEKAADQAGLDLNLGFTNDDQVSNAFNHAMMSGALPAAIVTAADGLEPRGTALSVDFQGVIEMSRSSHIAINDQGPSSRRPTVELVPSRTPSRASKAPKADSTGARPSPSSASTKLSSFHSFEEVGEAWVGPMASLNGSAHSLGPRPCSGVSCRPAVELDRPWLEPDSLEQEEKLFMPSPMPSIESPRSSKHSSPRLQCSSAVGKVLEQVTGSRSYATETHFRQTSTGTDSRHSLNIEQATHYGGSSSRLSSAGGPTGHGFGSNGGREYDGSQESLHSAQGQSVDSGQGLVPENEAQGRLTSLDEDFLPSSRSTTHSTHHSRSTGETRLTGSKHSNGSHRSSRKSHRQSRHASTRSFPLREDLLDGPPSTAISARDESQRSAVHRLEAVPERRINRHSVLASAIGSVVSMVSIVRSGSEEIGGGWRDGGTSGDELRQQILKARSTTRASTQILGPPVNAAGEDEWDETEHLKQQRSNASSRHCSSASAAYSHQSDVCSRYHSSRASRSSLERPGSGSHPHTPGGASIHAVASSHGDKYSPDQTRRQRPTVFAGRGWITPHPLESSVTERASAIVLPSDALPNGTILTYEEWQAMQEDGLRGHRNFSMTESNESERERHNNDRYRFSGWESRSWQEVQPADRDPNVVSAHCAVEPTASESKSERGSSKGQLQPSRLSSHHSAAPVSPSERLWERMEEGDAGSRSQSRKDDSVLSDRDKEQAYSGWSEWSQSRSRGWRSASKLCGQGP